jgi:hypothetical protein
MTIFELGALGEFVAAFAVVASLIYVGFQLSQSRVQMRAGAAQARTDCYITMQSAMMAIPELMEAQQKAYRGEELTEQDQHYLRNELNARAFMLENWYYQRKMGQLDSSMSKRLDHLMVFRRYAFARQWWEDVGSSGGFSDEFIQHVNDVLARFD